MSGPAVVLPRVGIGGSTFGNLFAPLSDEAARATFDAAWDVGVRYVDTAPHYGLGLSEERLGRFLAGRPREEYVLSSKVGRRLVPNPDHVPGELDTANLFAVPTTRRRVVDLTPSGIRASVDESLGRMGLDRLDVAYLHDPEELGGDVEGAMDALVALREEGVVGAVGAGSKQVDVLTRLVDRGGLDLVMVAGRYTLLEQPALRALVPACEAHGVGIVNVGAFNSGLLARPRPPADATYEYAPAPPSLLERAHRIADVCERYGTDLPTAAVQFALRARGVVNATFGVASPDEVHQLAARVDATVDDALWEDLVRAGLLPDGVVEG